MPPLPDINPRDMAVGSSGNARGRLDRMGCPPRLRDREDLKKGPNMSESDQNPEIIIPRYKVIVTYDIIPGNQDSYYQFVMGEFVPALQEMGLYMTEAWHTAYGHYPLRMATFVTEDLETIQKTLKDDRWRELEDRFKAYVRNYTRTVIEYRQGFQFLRHAGN